MKKNYRTACVFFRITFVLAILILPLSLNAQNVGIGDAGSSFTPAASSILELKSTTKGLLAPRMTTAQRTAVSSPAEGLMVFDTDLNIFYCYDGSYWQPQIGNYGQLENHGAYTDFNTTPNYLYGWNYVQGSTNGPNATSSQWYREIVSLGRNYPTRGTGAYSLELAYPRSNASTAGIWMRTVENGTIGSWTRFDAGSWNLTGNAGINTAVNFLGTTDAQHLLFKVNSTEVMRLSTDFNLGLGKTPRASARLNIYEATGCTMDEVTGTILIEHGDNGGNSSIVLRSANGGAHDYGYINYSDDGGAGTAVASTENALLTIGIKDDDSSNERRDDIAIMATGYVGINTKAPNSTLEVQGTVTIGNATGAGSLIMPDAAGNPKLQLVTDRSAAYESAIINNWNAAGNKGITIGSVRTDGIVLNVASGVTMASGLPTDAGTTRFQVDGDGDIVGDGTTFNVDATNNRVGIGTAAPAMNLDIYNVGAGVNAATSIIAREDQSAILYLGTIGNLSSYAASNAKKTAIIAEGQNTWGRAKLHFCLNSDGSSHAAANNASVTDSKMTIQYDGKVGIGTTSPSAMLDVNGTGNITTDYAYYNSTPASGLITGQTNAYSIRASGRILATEFNANSDLRIKNILSRSNSLTDLQTINKLVVTNYRLIDSIADGNKSKKGFIAQEIREIVPEAVSSLPNFIPDIYTLSESVNTDTVSKTFFVVLKKEHSLKKGNKVRLMTSKGTVEKEVSEVNSDCSFTVSDWNDTKEDKVFVYGKFVDDFLNVDYDRLFTTGIGAIQELSKQVDELKGANEKLKSENDEKTMLLKSIESRLKNIESALPTSHVK